MKYVITGSAGHISKPLSEKLLKEGNEVTIIGRNAAHLADLVKLGAKTAIGSVEDTGFLTKAFAGADAVYTMVPPNFSVTNWKAFIEQTGKNYAKAISANDIKYVVNLSSIGAHMPDGAGPVSGLHYAENALNELKNVNIKHLRPSYFFTNLLGNVDMAKNLNIIGSNFGGPDFKMVFVYPDDIAEVAAAELLNLDFTGHSIRYIASDENTTDEVAKAFGDAIGKPGLPWVVFSDEQAYEGLVKAGWPQEIAKNYTEMGHALQSGEMMADYWKNRPAQLGKMKLNNFAKIFASVYNSEEQAVHH